MGGVVDRLGPRTAGALGLECCQGLTLGSQVLVVVVSQRDGVGGW